MKKNLTLTIVFILGFVSLSFGQIKKINKLKPTVKQAVYFNVSRPLRDIIEENQFNNNIKPFEYREEEHNRFIIHPKINKLNEKDPLSIIQQNYYKYKAAQSLIEDANFDGTPSMDGVAPPDTQGDVNSSYYMQCTNGHTTIYNLDGTVAKASFPTSDFWNGTPYNSSNDGDAIILWDEDAGRWLVSQFAVPSGDGKYYELIAISTSSDPLGSYYQYAFEYANFPDYPKLAVWPDGYYCGFNYFDKSTNAYMGTLASVYERDKMLTGDSTARVITFGPNSSYFSVFPTDADAFPASGTPCYFMSDATGSTSGNTDIYMFEFHTDWSNTSNSSFGLSQTLTAAPYDLFSTDTEVPQSGTSNKLDLLHYRIMYRPYFRHFSTYDDIVMTRTVNDGGVAAVRWYEFRNSGSGWSIYQQGTYNPGDGLWRWMPSIAMNANGDIALGYSVSSSGMHPGLRGVARYASDPLNTMTTNEYNMFTGSGSEDASGLSRWGDYSMVSIDATDNYSFWFTTEYTTGGWNWRTRITHFHLPVLTPPTISNVSPASLYEDRGKQLTITGTNLTSCTFDIGGITGSIVSNDGSTAVVTFPAGNYTNGTLTATNNGGNDTYSVTVNTRNIIPVVSGASATSDNHPTIQSAFDGLYAWYGTTAFDSGDLPGKKTIEVYAGTYNEGATLTSGLNPTSADSLIIKNHPGDMVDVDATGNNYGFNLNTVDYVTLKGFTVHSADLDNIYAQGNNVTISHNKTYGSVGGSGIKVETGTPFTITNNLSYGNYKYGIEDLSANNTIKNNTADDNGGTYTPATGVSIFDYDVESGDYTGWVVGSGDWGVYNDGTYSNSPTHMFGITNGNDYIQYETVDVTGYDNLTVSCYARSYASNMHNNDDLYGYYSFDGSNWTQFFHIQNDHNSYTQYSATGITPTSTSLYIKFSGICNSNEYWFVDDILVTGDETAPASNTGAGLYVANVSATVENNIFVAKGGNNSYYSLISPGNSATSDYNTYYTTNSAAFDYNGTQDNTGPMGSNDVLSDPLFVGSGDYHIQSDAGSYHGGEWPPLTAVSGTWTNDANVSPALDAGNPADPYQNEPQSGNIINCGAYGNTVQASKSNTVVSLTWDGSTSTDWQDATNWTPEQIPTSSDDITIPNGCPNYPVVDDGISTVAVCNNITIENAASLTIAPNGYMTVSGTITNNAGTAGITIQSDATGTGSLIQNSTSGVNATVQRFLPATSRAWHFVAAPISDATVSVFPTTANLYYYDESTDDFWTGTNYDAGSTMGWTNFTSGSLTPAKGYLFNYFQDTLTFTGNLNTTSAGQNIPIDYTDHGTNAPNGTTYDNYDGWNLLANPFTSAIDWTAVDAHAANLYDAIYVWDGANATYKSYVVGTDSWDSQGTNGATQYIPAMQGFFVKVNESLGTTGTLNIPANARVHNTQAFWKADNKNNANLMRVAVSSNSYTDETVIRLRENATTAMDDHLDAFKLFSYVAAAPQIYTIDENRTEYSINTLPDNGQIFTVPLLIYTYTNDFSISFPEFNFDKYNVYLIDNNNPSIDLNNDVSEGKIFRFKKSGNEEQNRFELLFSPKQEPTEIIANETKTVNIYPNPTSGNLFVRVNDNKDTYLLVIMNELGQIVMEKEFSGNNYQKISIAGKTPGMYFLKIYSNNQVISFKKIILN